MLCGCWWFWTCWWNFWNGRFSFHSTVIKVFWWFWGEQFEEKAQFGTSVPPRHCSEHLTWLLGVFLTTSDPDLNWFTGLLTPYEPTSSPETIAGCPLWLFPSPGWRLGVNGLLEQRWNQIRCNLLSGKLFFFFGSVNLNFSSQRNNFPLHRFHGWTEHD